MTRLPRGLSGKQVRRALERAGFYLKRQKGSHMVLRRDHPFAQVIVPSHRQIDTGTLASSFYLPQHAGSAAKGAFYGAWKGFHVTRHAFCVARQGFSGAKDASCGPRMAALVSRQPAFVPQQALREAGSGEGGEERGICGQRCGVGIGGRSVP